MLRGILKTILIVCCLVGIVGLFAAFQLHQIQGQAQPDAEVQSIAEFLDKGPPRNAYVELTGVVFGPPLIENISLEGKDVWFPLYAAKPNPRKPAPPAVLLCMSRLPDEAAVGETTASSTVRALIMRRMPEPNLWRAPVPASLAQTYPGIDLAKTTILVEPELWVAGLSFDPELVFDSATQTWAWGLGGGLLAVGMVGLLWLGRREPAAKASLTPSRATAGSEETQRRRTDLENDPALSGHEFETLQYSKRLTLIWLVGGFLFLFGFFFFVTSVIAFKKDVKWMLAGFGVSACMVVGGPYFIQKIRRYGTLGVARIAVCNNGLRWQKTADGPIETALWSEVADMNRKIQKHYATGVLTWDELTITLASGQVLLLAFFTLSSYHIFAKFATEGYLQYQSSKSFKAGGGFLPRAGAQTLMTKLPS